MTLQEESVIRQDKKAQTMYISIPAKIVLDSGFKFAEGDKILISVIRDKKEIYIKGINENGHK